MESRQLSKGAILLEVNKSTGKFKRNRENSYFRPLHLLTTKDKAAFVNFDASKQLLIVNIEVLFLPLSAQIDLHPQLLGYIIKTARQLSDSLAMLAGFFRYVAF